MMGHKEKLKHGEEFDVVTNWRKLLCYMQNTKASRKIKKQMTRRNRRQDKQRGYYEKV
jgi:KaiC/GvpD/RAD55 family RecA-like ATPase